MDAVAEVIEVQYDDIVQVHSALNDVVRLTIIEETVATLRNANEHYVILSRDQAMELVIALIKAAARASE